MKLLGAATFLVVISQLSALGEEPVLVRFIHRGDSSLESVAGVLVEDTRTELRVLNLETLHEDSYSKKAVLSLRKPASEQDVATLVGVAPLVAWLVKTSLPPQPEPGRVALVDGAFAYINRGADQGVRASDQFNVYRGEEEIKDPETGEVLGKKQRRIGVVEIVEVRDKLSKVRLIGDVEIPLEAGDTVRLATSEQAVAVLPLGTPSGAVAGGSSQLTGELTTYLTKNEVPVVERSQLAEVLAELVLQQSGIFDENTIQEIGRHTAAFAVITGTIESQRRNSKVNLKLIEVETGKVLHAVSLRTTIIEGDSSTVDLSGHPILIPRAAAIAHWSLDGDTHNALSKEFDATIVGDVGFVNGKSEEAIELGGRSKPGYLRLQPDDDARLIRDQDFTIAAWLRPKANERRWPIAGQGVWGSQGWVLEILPSGVISFESWDENDADNGAIRSGGDTITFGAWQHVAVAVTRSQSGNQTRLFVNGDEVASGNVRDGDLGTARYYIGRLHEDYFFGVIDEVWLFRSSLTEEQIRKLAAVDDE